MSDTCKDCKFYYGNGYDGTCFLNPPKVFHRTNLGNDMSNEDFLSVRPIVNSTDFCSHHQRKPRKP